MNNLGEISEYLQRNYKVKIKVIPLGDWRCFLSHLMLITIPNLCKKIAPKGRNRKKYIASKMTTNIIKKSVLKELKSDTRIPSTWILIITSKNISIDNLLT